MRRVLSRRRESTKTKEKKGNHAENGICLDKRRRFEMFDDQWRRENPIPVKIDRSLQSIDEDPIKNREKKRHRSMTISLRQTKTNSLKQKRRRKQSSIYSKRSSFTRKDLFNSIQFNAKGSKRRSIGDLFPRLMKRDFKSTNVH